MATLKEKKVLVSGASMAGLSTAWWMNRLGYKVTVVKIADQPRTAGVALVGDAGYCASPAAGMGASLAVYGATVLADALQKHNGNFESAFQDYNKNLRPFIDQVQATAEMNLSENFILSSEVAIEKRNKQVTPFWL